MLGWVSWVLGVFRLVCAVIVVFVQLVLAWVLIAFLIAGFGCALGWLLVGVCEFGGLGCVVIMWWWVLAVWLSTWVWCCCVRLLFGVDDVAGWFG